MDCLTIIIIVLCIYLLLSKTEGFKGSMVHRGAKKAARKSRRAAKKAALILAKSSKGLSTHKDAQDALLKAEIASHEADTAAKKSAVYSQVGAEKAAAKARDAIKEAALIKSRTGKRSPRLERKAEHAVKQAGKAAVHANAQYKRASKKRGYKKEVQMERARLAQREKTKLKHEMVVSQSNDVTNLLEGGYQTVIPGITIPYTVDAAIANWS